MSELAADAPTAGALLRRAREAAGLHVASLAVSLKVPVRKLEALEQDRYDELPDAVFARALASAVCRTLKIDAQPILERLPQSHAPRLVQDQDGLNAPFRAPGDASAPGWADQLTRPGFLAVFALLLGALVLVFLPTMHRDDTASAKADAKPDATPAPLVAPALTAAGPSTEQPVAASPDTVPVPQPSASSEVVPVNAVAPAAPSAPAASAPARAASASGKPAAVVAAAGKPASAPAAGRPAVAASAAHPVAAVSQASAPAAAAPAASGVVTFRASAPTWVEVTDSRGGVALRRLLASGESAGASGVPPLSVTVGSANATAVQVRGKPYDLAPVSRDNVARFQVK